MKFRIGIALFIIACMSVVAFGLKDNAQKPIHPRETDPVVLQGLSFAQFLDPFADPNRPLRLTPDIKSFDKIVFKRTDNGFGFGTAYSITITGNRKAEFFRTTGGQRPTIRFELSNSEYNRLVDAINDNYFFMMRDSGCSHTDGPETDTSISANGITHAMRGCPPLDYLHNVIEEIAADHDVAYIQYSIWFFRHFYPQKKPVGTEWLIKAAEGGDAEAQFTLGEMYEEGKELPKDLVAAYKWTYLGAIGYQALSGIDNFQKYKLLELKMTPEQFLEAKEQIEQWQSKR